MKDISKLTKEEARTVLKIIKFNWENFKLTKRKEGEIRIVKEDGKDAFGEPDEIILNKHGGYYKQFPSSRGPAPNPFLVAQYLMDQGYRFEYNID